MPLHSLLSFHALGGTLVAASSSCTVLAGRGTAGRLSAASCCSTAVNSAFVLLRISIFQVPVRSIAEIAVMTVACVARQLKVTRHTQMTAKMAANGRARRAQKASTVIKSDPLERSKMTPRA
jgi:hypothetical protein